MQDKSTPHWQFQRDNGKADAMYARYCDGLSLSQVATEFGVTRQSVYKMFRLRGWGLRQRPAPLPTQVFNGHTYTLRNTGYFGRTNGARTLLHRDIWEFHNGPIPYGWDVHHKVEDRTHNDPSNLECLPKSDHTRLHHARRR